MNHNTFQPQTDATLGSLVTTRGQGAVHRALTVAILALLILGCLAIAALCFIALLSGRWAALIGIAIAAGVTLLSLAVIRSTFRTVRFHEAGLVETLGPHQRTIYYADIARMQYSITRQYYKGIYAGTIVNMLLFPDQGRKFRYGGRYKEKPRGWAMTVFGRTFEASDELDVVRDIIAGHIAARMADQLAQGQPVDWPGSATLTADGITPIRGPRKGHLIPWHAVAMALEESALRLFTHADRRSFLDIAINAVNLFPAMQLIGTLTADDEPVHA